MAGYGYSTSFFRKARIAGQDCFIDNPGFTRIVFPPRLARIPAPFVLKAKKTAGTFRIFVFGESAAQGDPRPQLAASRYLKSLLEQRFPAQRFEIINTAITAINSHVIRRIGRECAAREGDCWVIYMGNNEMVGPFGAATVFGRKAAPLPLVRLNLALQDLRITQLLGELMARLRPDSARLSQWGGMEMFLQNEVAPADKRKEVVYENFRRNLEDMLHAGTSSGARIVLSTVAVNLKDCPPFGSLSQAGLSESDRAAFEKAWREGNSARDGGDLAAAVEHYTSAAKVFPQSASAQYQLASGLLALTNLSLAKQHFELARDCDTLPFRIDSRLNEILKQAAARFASAGVRLCDAAGLLTDSHGAVSGQEYFYEHVHPTCDGNYRLALLWAEEVAHFVPEAARDKSPAQWASQAECERHIGCTDWNRVSALEEMIGRMQDPPLNSQSNNSNRLAHLKRELTAMRDRMSTNAASARTLYLDALQRAPDDCMLHEAFAEYLGATGDSQEALVQRRIVATLTPHSYFAHFILGTELKDQRQFPEAETELRQAARINPEQTEVRLELGAVCALQGRYDAALVEFEKARHLAPWDPRPLLFAGEALWKQKRSGEAFVSLHEAIRLKPDYVEAHYQLGEQLALTTEFQEAIAEFQAVLRLKPNHLRARVNLGVALARLGRLEDALRECDEALRIDPANKQALQLRRQIMADPRRR